MPPDESKPAVKLRAYILSKYKMDMLTHKTREHGTHLLFFHSCVEQFAEVCELQWEEHNRVGWTGAKTIYGLQRPQLDGEVVFLHYCGRGCEINRC
jgi:hypothetical protein